MRLSKLLAVSALVCTLGGAAFAAGDSAPPRRQWAVVYLQEPTLIGSTIVQGPVLFTHDDAKMTRGEPCLEDKLGCVLTEYQFAGDAEGHGVPLHVNAH